MDASAPLDLGQPAHAGVVVPDLDDAMARYTAELGVRWASVVAYGRPPHRSRFTCSLDGPVLIELIEQVPGTVWMPEHGAPVHHLAYWTDDLADHLDRLTARGLTVEAKGPTFAYLRSSAGLRIELMDTAVRPTWDGWLAGGAFTL